MQVNQSGTKFEFIIEGPISEKCPLFDYLIDGASEVVVNLEKMTFINSIGVKNWITWTLKIPTTCKLTLVRCPFVMINQVNIVQGFLPKHARIDSFFAPYISEAGDEKTILLQRGKDYEYATPTQEALIAFPETLTQNNQTYEPDFIITKIKTFLT